MRKYSLFRFLLSAELGAKRTFLGDRLSVHAAIFDEAWNNVQSDQLLADGLSFAGNVGDAHVFGLEAETSWKISQSLRLDSSMSLSEAEIQKARPSFPAPPEAALPGAPHVMLGASLSYNRYVCSCRSCAWRLVSDRFRRQPV